MLNLIFKNNWGRGEFLKIYIIHPVNNSSLRLPRSIYVYEEENINQINAIEWINELMNDTDPWTETWYYKTLTKVPQPNKYGSGGGWGANYKLLCYKYKESSQKY